MTARARRGVSRIATPLTGGTNPDVVYVQRQWHVTDDDWAVIRAALEAWWADAALALRDGIDACESVARGCDAAQDAVWPMTGTEVPR